MKALGVPLSGRIPASHLAEPGRAIARLTDIGFGARARDVLRRDRPDAAVPDDLLQAAVKVLAAWGWAQRPAAVVSVGSHTRPQLVQSLAAGLARIGRLPYLGSVEHTGSTSPGRSNSAQRLRSVYGTYHLSTEVAKAIEELQGKPILLVDDRLDTGWTITVVADLLRHAGAGPIYPLVIAVEA